MFSGTVHPRVSSCCRVREGTHQRSTTSRRRRSPHQRHPSLLRPLALPPPSLATSWVRSTHTLQGSAFSGLFWSFVISTTAAVEVNISNCRYVCMCACVCLCLCVFVCNVRYHLQASTLSCRLQPSDSHVCPSWIHHGLLISRLKWRRSPLTRLNRCVVWLFSAWLLHDAVECRKKLQAEHSVKCITYAGHSIAFCIFWPCDLDL